MSRSWQILLGAALLLGVLVFVFVNPLKDPVGRNEGGGGPLFKGSVVTDADRLRIQSFGAPETVLLKKGSEWVVGTQNDFPADTAAVGTLLRSIGEARSAAVVSRNPENRQKFGVDTTGVRVDVLAGGTSLAQLIVGNPGQDFTTSYVRLEGKDDVHVVRGINRNLFTRPQGFRDRTLLRFEPDQAAAVIRQGEDSWELTRADTTWVVGRPGELPGPAAPAAVEALLHTLSTLSADGFVEAGADTLEQGLDPPSGSFTVRLMDGTSSTFQLGAKNDRNQVFARRPDRALVYLLGDWRVQNLNQTLVDLRAAPQ